MWLSFRSTKHAKLAPTFFLLLLRSFAYVFSVVIEVFCLPFPCCYWGLLPTFSLLLLKSFAYLFSVVIDFFCLPFLCCYWGLLPTFSLLLLRSFAYLFSVVIEVFCLHFLCCYWGLLPTFSLLLLRSRKKVTTKAAMVWNTMPAICCRRKEDSVALLTSKSGLWGTTMLAKPCRKTPLVKQWHRRYH